MCSHSKYTLLESVPVPGDEDDDMTMFVRKYQCTYMGGPAWIMNMFPSRDPAQDYYATYSDMNFHCQQSGSVFTTSIEVYHRGKRLFAVEGTDYNWESPYFINHLGQCYFIVTERYSIVTRDMTGTVVSRCSTNYGYNVLMSIDHVDDYFILEVYCYGYGSTPDEGREGGLVVTGVVRIDQALGGNGTITLTRNQFDPKQKSFITGTSGNYIYLPLNDETVSSFQSDISNLDYVTMWQQLCDNMWRKNTRSPLRLLLSDPVPLHDRIDVTVDPGLHPQQLLGATSIRIRTDETSSEHKGEYDMNLYWLMGDVASAEDRASSASAEDRANDRDPAKDDLRRRLKRVLFMHGDQNPASTCIPDDLCLIEDEISQDDYLVQFDDIKVKLSLQCQLTLYDRPDTDRHLDGKTYYVYDSRVCRIKARWSMPTHP